MRSNLSVMTLVTGLVRMKGLEPSRLAALAPKTSVSTNSTTSAYTYIVRFKT